MYTEEPYDRVLREVPFDGVISDALYRALGVRLGRVMRGTIG